MAPETVTLTSPDGDTEAEFVPEANMVCHSLRHRGAEWLEQRLGLDAYVEQGKTMGIPLLHPWANRLAHPGYAVAGKEVSLPRRDPRIRLDGDRPIHGVMPSIPALGARGRARALDRQGQAQLDFARAARGRSRSPTSSSSRRPSATAC